MPKHFKNIFLGNLLALTIILFVPRPSVAQTFFINIYGGLSNYQGDLQNHKVLLQTSHPAWGMGLRAELNNRMLLFADFSFGTISGNDKWTEATKARNLNFKSAISEFSLGMEYNLFDLYSYKVSPYFFTGIGIFNFSPTTKNAAGQTVILGDLRTEGQGLIKGREPYKTQALSIPLGAGLQWSMSYRSRLAVFVGLRKTFTDYIDDVSTSYVDQQVLSNYWGSTTAALAYRGDELPNAASYPAEGTARGNPRNKDSYYFSGVSYRFRLIPKFRAKKYKFDKRKSKTTCPEMF